MIWQVLRIPFPGHHGPVVGLPVVERVGQVELVDLLLVLHPGQRHVHAAHGGVSRGGRGGDGRLGRRGGRGSVRRDVAAVREPPDILRSQHKFNISDIKKISLVDT